MKPGCLGVKRLGDLYFVTGDLTKVVFERTGILSRKVMIHLEQIKKSKESVQDFYYYAGYFLSLFIPNYQMFESITTIIKRLKLYLWGILGG